MVVFAEQRQKASWTTWTQPDEPRSVVSFTDASMATKSTIRFALGDPNGWQSSTWRVWHSGKGRDIYVASRDIGALLKVSLHEELWRVAWTREALADEADRVAIIDGDASVAPDDRLVAEWLPDLGRLEGTPMSVAFAVILGRFSLGWASPHELAWASPNDPKKGVDWITELPHYEEAWEFLVLISDPGIKVAPREGIPVGEFPLPDGSQGFVVRRRVPHTTGFLTAVVNLARGTPQHLIDQKDTSERAIYRCHGIFPPSGTPSGRVGTAVEVAVNRNPPTRADPHPKGVLILPPTGTLVDPTDAFASVPKVVVTPPRRRPPP